MAEDAAKVASAYFDAWKVNDLRHHALVGRR
jgi:hypothetical protein